MEESFSFNFKSFWFQLPGYLKLKLPETVVEEIRESIEKLEKKEIENIPYEQYLAGHLHSEFQLPITRKIKYLVESLSYEYDKIFGEDTLTRNFTREDVDNGVAYELKTLWINYAKKYDFNPIHNHSGLYSFVIWAKIPYNLEDELERYKTKNNSTSLFSFNITDAVGNLRPEKLPIDKSWEWSMVFFPAGLPHSVNPFYTSDETRISISGNVFGVKL
jgi:hypothetical protein